MSSDKSSGNSGPPSPGASPAPARSIGAPGPGTNRPEATLTGAQTGAPAPTAGASTLNDASPATIVTTGNTSTPQALAAPVPLDVPERLGPYTVIRALGAGGMGTVYLARDEALDRFVALKVLSKDLAADAGFTERFLQEARAIAKVSHPNVVPIYFAGKDQQICFFAMEHVSGITLDSMIHNRGALEIGQAVSIITQAARGLEAAHARAILHRDIKPSNIIVDEAGQVKLLDFGLAKDLQASTSCTTTGTFLGTPRYLSPEQGRGKKPDFRSDIYALGVTFYEALSGAPPFDADTPLGVIDKHVHEPLPSIQLVRKDIPLLVVKVLERMLAKDPAERHPSYESLLSDLTAAACSTAASTAITAPIRDMKAEAPARPPAVAATWTRLPGQSPAATPGRQGAGGSLAIGSRPRIPPPAGARAGVASVSMSGPSAGNPVPPREEVNAMDVRQGCVSGQFYPAGLDECRALLEECVATTRAKRESEVEGPFRAGIVPHAGWVFSGVTAAHVYATIHDFQKPVTFVLLGAVHVQGVRRASLYADGFWRTPLGDVKIDTQLALKLQTGLGKELVVDPGAHAREHSLEVQVPFIKHLFPQAMIVPIMVPPDERATRVGEGIASATADIRRRIVVIGSSDLTHYGHNYHFLPQGEGQRALNWVKQVSDKRVIDLALAMKADDIVPEVDLNQNACGAGAIAATIAYAKSAGAIKGHLLHHTTSHDVIPRGEPESFVGYAGIVF